MQQGNTLQHAQEISRLLHAAEDSALTAYEDACRVGAELARFARDTGMSAHDSRKSLGSITKAQAAQMESIAMVGSAHLRAEQDLKVLGDFPLRCPSEEAALEETADVVPLRKSA